MKIQTKIELLFLLYLFILLFGTAIVYVWLGKYYIVLLLIPMAPIIKYYNQFREKYPDDYEKAMSAFLKVGPYYGRLVFYSFILILATMFLIAYLTKP